MQLRAGDLFVHAEPGDSILSALRAAEKNIFSICGGRGMCGTCRVAIGEDWLDRLPLPSSNETRLLRVLKNAAANHRLACQTILDERHDGLTFSPDPPPTRHFTKESST